MISFVALRSPLLANFHPFLKLYQMASIFGNRAYAFSEYSPQFPVIETNPSEFSPYLPPKTVPDGEHFWKPRLRVFRIFTSISCY